MKTFIELLNSGVIQKIELKETVVGSGFDVTLHFYQSPIYTIDLHVGIDENIECIVPVINAIIDSIEPLKDKSSPLSADTQEMIRKAAEKSKIAKRIFIQDDDDEDGQIGEVANGVVD